MALMKLGPGALANRVGSAKNSAPARVVSMSGGLSSRPAIDRFGPIVLPSGVDRMGGTKVASSAVPRLLNVGKHVGLNVPTMSHWFPDPPESPVWYRSCRLLNQMS